MVSRPQNPAPATAPDNPQRALRMRYGRLALAAVVSLALHLVGGWWLEYEPFHFDESPPLTAELKSLPPPPVPQPAPPPKRKAKKPPPAKQDIVSPAPAPVAEPAFSPQPPEVAAAQVLPEPPVAAAAPVEPAPAEIAKAPEAPPEIPLPERIELVYTALYGTVGIYVGEASYRFEYHDGRYRIESKGEAQGLIALFYRGVLRAVSQGRITSAGLVPEEVFIERGGPDKRETARLDWDTRTITFKDDTRAPLEAGTLDLLSFMLQFYFLPPTEGRLQLPVVTPRRMVVYTFERQGMDRISIPLGDFDAERWARSSQETQGADALIWLAPEFGHMPVRIRLRDPERGTAELRLAKILTDPRKP